MKWRVADRIIRFSDDLIALEFGRLPLMFNLFLALFIIFAVSFPFALGEQILPADPHFPFSITDTECQVFSNLTIGLRDWALTLGFSVNSGSVITLNNAWRLFRLRINGSFLHEELRATDHSGLFLQKPNGHAFFLFFEMAQEGDISVDVKCLDETFSTLSLSVERFDNHSVISIFHDNNDVTNVYASPQGLTVFTRPNIKAKTWRFVNALDAEFNYSGIDVFMQDNSEYRELEAKFLVDSYLINGSFDLIASVLPEVLAAGRLKWPIVLNYNGKRWPGLSGLIQALAKQRISIVDHPHSAFCWKDALRPNPRRLTVSDDDARVLRETLVGNVSPGKLVLYSARHTSEPGPANVNDIQAAVTEANLLWKPAGLSGVDIHEVIATLSSARAMISHDDGDNIAHAVWMPPDSPVFVLLDSQNATLSRAVAFLEKTGRAVTLIPSDPQPLEAHGRAEEAGILRDWRYHVNLASLKRALDNIR
jgi:hypothetical protein